MEPVSQSGYASDPGPDQGWEPEATNWTAWARTPGHDAYSYFSPAFFQLVPKPGSATLEVGCGEGRVSRDLASRGHRVTGIDASPTLIRLAQEADSIGTYLLADAAALPFENASFDLVIAYNSLMDIKDMPRAVSEAARVLIPGGRFCICVTHPTADAGKFSSDDADAPFIISGSYLERRWLEFPVERDGLRLTFRSWAHPLESYTRALEAAGFLIEAIREPAPTADSVAIRPILAKWQRLPMFLHIRAIWPA